MYMVAIKSAYSQIGEGSIYVIDDGSLTGDQKHLLRYHLGNPSILPVGDAPRRRVPKGGCWERLLYMAELGRTDYVIQLDSDTLTRDAIPEFVEAANNGRPFILSGGAGHEIVPLAHISARARTFSNNHLQAFVEKRLDQIQGIKPFYVRGSAAFFGLPKGSVSLEDIEAFSDVMSGTIGPRWQEWGSEQITVNYLLANLTGTLVLQPPTYIQHWLSQPKDNNAFIHFIGTHRFRHLFYTRESMKIIAKLRANTHRKNAGTA
jgi:hypothetical protein